MTNTDKILARLKKTHAQYVASVESLSAQLAHITERLAAAKEQAFRAEEAIAALEGRTTEIKRALQAAMQSGGTHTRPQEGEPPTLSSGSSPEIPQNGNSALPPAEPGFKWAKNAEGEDVLIPINAPISIPETAEGLPLPAVDYEEDFTDSPEDLMRG